jgi:beta-glucosidase
LKKNQTVALIGPLADDAANMLGSWAGRGRAADVVTMKSDLAMEVGTPRMKYAKGGGIKAATDKEIEEAVAVAKSSDVAILALGEDAPEMTAEAASRAHLELPGRQEELLEKVAATGTPVVLVLFSGRPLALPWVFEHIPAVLAAWFPGVQAGPALVRVLYGETSPSGRLVVSWPRAVGQLPLYYNALNTGRPAGKIDLTHPPRTGEEKYVSRYIDEQNSPQFPFGYGLSYTTVTYGAPEPAATTLSAKVLNASLRERNFDQQTAFTVTASVTNTGKKAIEETVQLYVGLRGTSMEEPVRVLKAFQRVSLAPGDAKKVIFQLGPEAFAIWGENAELSVESSQAMIWVGPDSVRGEGVAVEIGE